MQCPKAMKEGGDKVSADEKAAIEKAIAALKEALTGNDKDLIEAKTKDLTDASAKMAERLYAAGQADQAGQAGAGGGHEQHAQGGASDKKKEDVVDAEFEEVKDDQNKQS